MDKPSLVKLLKNQIHVIDDNQTMLYLQRKDNDPIAAIISTSDLPKIAEINKKWSALWSGSMKNYYVKATHLEDGKETALYLHRFLLDAPKGMQVDHINRDTLDNRRSNLRIVTASENQWNKGPNVNSKSGIKNINWDQKTNSWTVKFYRNKKHVWVGRFDDIVSAKRALEGVND